MHIISQRVASETEWRALSQKVSPDLRQKFLRGEVPVFDDRQGTRLVHPPGTVMRDLVPVARAAEPTPTKDVAAIVATIERNTAALRAEQAARPPTPTPTPTPEAKATPAPQGTDAARRRVFGREAPPPTSAADVSFRAVFGKPMPASPTTTTPKATQGTASACERVFGSKGGR